MCNNIPISKAGSTAHFEAAQAALDAGDLGTYQDEIDAAQAAVSQAANLAAGGGEGDGTTGTPTPSASATPSG